MLGSNIRHNLMSGWTSSLEAVYHIKRHTLFTSFHGNWLAIVYVYALGPIFPDIRCIYEDAHLLEATSPWVNLPEIVKLGVWAV